MRSLLVGLLLPLLGCVSQGVYEAEVARSSGLEVALRERESKIGVLEQRVRDLEKSGEILEIERSSLDDERIALINSLEDLRQGNAIVRDELERERAARLTVQDEVAQLNSTYNSLVDELEQEVEAGKIQILELEGRLQVRALDQILFRPGSVQVSEGGRQVLARVASQLRKLRGYQIRVEGHTDDRPIATEHFPSNWELSVARASRVVRVLQDEGVDPSVLEAVGYAEFRPLARNDTPADRARNRRIEIILEPLAAPE
jgi:chemotaxis protein MotB